MTELTETDEYFLEDAQATMEAGGALALSLEEAGRLEAQVVTLEGPLGCGKTTFVQGFGAALGADPEGIVSPTFTLAAIHEGRTLFSHMDLYRLGEKEDPAAEFVGAGLEELLDGLSLVEWPGRLADSFWPEDRVRVFLREHPPKPGKTPPQAGPGRAVSFSGSLPPALSGRLRAFPRLGKRPPDS
ncbi:MAG: tRNA (adenosine(37)-N6)-threonylcarbamoyltransferase complex ATPase subunit type 1 TsaE [Deltaproteobacteria bacterium]|nr:tRNA (adenosine(37)-N6)-threonylcarbamoyltransferase complex ATPase subunit type 1 TsaE [Deltaproteobacteria bacterium]